MGKRVWDEELSECRFVMRRIGIECYERSLEKAGIASKQHNIILPLKGADFREAELTTLCFGRSLITRTFVR